MRKTTFHLLLFLVFTITGVKLFDWYFYHPQINTANLQNTLINKVQAKPAPVIAPPSVEQMAEHQSLLSQHTAISTVNQLSLPLKSTLTLQFEAVNLQLNDFEQQKLHTFLTDLTLNESYQVKITSGPAPAENQTLLPQLTKLRAQTIARLIYPHTQQISMRYQPQMAQGTAIVEVIPRQLSTIQQ